MDNAQALTAAIGLASAVGVVLAYFKYKPGQRERIGLDMAEGRINVAQGTLNIAHGSIQLVTKTLEDQFKRMDAEMDDMRTEHATYRGITDERLTELTWLLREASDGRVAAERERDKVIARLTKAEARVTELEAEVARLKATRPEET